MNFTDAELNGFLILHEGSFDRTNFISPTNYHRNKSEANSENKWYRIATISAPNIDGKDKLGITELKIINGETGVGMRTTGHITIKVRINNSFSGSPIVDIKVKDLDTTDIVGVLTSDGQTNGSWYSVDVYAINKFNYGVISVMETYRNISSGVITKLYDEERFVSVPPSGLGNFSPTNYTNTIFLGSDGSYKLQTSSGDTWNISANPIKPVFFPFDCVNKIAGSNVGAPIQLFRNSHAGQLSIAPGDPTWTEELDQSSFDNLKYTDGLVYQQSTTTNNMYRDVMISLDLSQIMSDFYGSNNALKESLSLGSKINIFGSGSGSDASEATSGLDVYLWDGLEWVFVNSSSASGISLIEIFLNNRAYVDAGNKVYIAFTSKYPSNGVIQSSVSIDYIKFNIQAN